jgi:hypothetical protein
MSIRKLFVQPNFDARLREVNALFAVPEERRLPGPSRLSLVKQERRTIVAGAPYIDGRQFNVDDAEELWLPLTAIGGTSLVTLAEKEYDLKPTRNFLPLYFQFETAALAEALVLFNFQIGGKNMLLGSGVIPCGTFSGASAPKLFRGAVANTNKPMTFTIKNKSGATVVVYGFVGGLAEPE